MKLLKHFDFTNDKKLDLDYWNVRVGDRWANNEKQHYVDKAENLYFDDGLVIQGTLKDGVYESSRIDTKGKLFFKYGRIDVKVKLPKGVGTWPAVWLMSEKNKYGHWPKSGEIDLVEHVGRKLDNVFFCLHTEAHNHRQGDYYYTDFQEKNLSDNVNTFSLLWEENAFTYYVNNKEIVKYKKGKNGFDPTHKGWPFDEDFYLIINLALGGGLGGPIDDSIFPQKFIIKDIKIYQ